VNHFVFEQHEAGKVCCVVSGIADFGLQIPRDWKSVESGNDDLISPRVIHWGRNQEAALAFAGLGICAEHSQRKKTGRNRG
jgi:hypothetical protein